MRLTLISSGGDGYESRGHLEAVLLAPDGHDLQERAEAFRRQFSIPASDLHNERDWNALLAQLRGEPPPPEQPFENQNYQEQRAARRTAETLTRERFIQARLLEEHEDRTDTLRIFVRWLIRDCGWQSAQHERWQINREEERVTLDVLSLPPQPQNAQRPYDPAPDQFPAERAFAALGYHLTPAERDDLTELGWLTEGRCSYHDAEQALAWARRWVSLHAQLNTPDLNETELQAINWTQPTQAQLTAATAGRRGRTPLGRACGRAGHYDAARAELVNAVHYTKPLHLLLQAVSPPPARPVHFGPPNDEHQLTTGDLQPYPAVVAALKADGLWPRPAL